MELASIDMMSNIKSIKDIDIEGKKVLIRVDFNVPMDKNYNISDDTRIRESIPTINYCIDAGAAEIILVSHLARPTQVDMEYSLKHILKRLERYLNRPVVFAGSIKALKNMEPTLPEKSIILLENIRFEKGEELNDDALSKELASLCDVFVSDAFGTSHREHASTHGVTKFVKDNVAGFLLKKEIDHFIKAFSSPLKPVLLIIGGAKVSSKLALLHNILNVVDKIIIGGAMSNTFLRALGYDTQASMVEEDLVDEAASILVAAREKGVKIYLPVDVVTTTSVVERSDITISPAQDIKEGHMAVDMGPATVKLFNEVIALSQTIIWNGPLGIFEVREFSRGTFSIAHAIANTYAFSLIGGGDTANAVIKAGEKDNMSFISTGGGASLELLEGKILPAFKVLDRK